MTDSGSNSSANSSQDQKNIKRHSKNLSIEAAISSKPFTSNNNEVFDVDPSYYMTSNVPLGIGSYGTVCAFRNQKTGEYVAIKKCRTLFDNLIDTKRILREIVILRHLRHDNIIGLKDVFLPPDRMNFKQIYIVTEKMESDLKQVLHIARKFPDKQKITDLHCQYFLYQILRALKYIHSAGVLHRDLKPSNLLVNSDCNLKLCDFGLSRSVNTREKNQPLTTLVATKWYRAPELLLETERYDEAVDVWSAGCILAELILKKPMFVGGKDTEESLEQLKVITDILGTPTDDEIKNMGNEQARKYMKSMKPKQRQPFDVLFPIGTNSYAIEIMEKMLTFSPDKRASVQECLEHPYFKEYHDPKDEPTSTSIVDAVFAFENAPLTVPSLREWLVNEVQVFHPEVPS